MKVISLDPGETHGLCMAESNHNKDWKIIRTDAIKDAELFSLLENEPNVDLVIYEQYKLYASKAKAMVNNEFLTVQAIGVIKYICRKRGIPTLKSPTMNKAFWTNKRLKQLGLYVTIEHKRDAIRHFLFWLYFTAKEASLKDLTL